MWCRISLKRPASDHLRCFPDLRLNQIYSFKASKQSKRTAVYMCVVVFNCQIEIALPILTIDL